MARFKDLVLDSTDQAGSAAFWSALLGLQIHPHAPGQPVPLGAPGPDPQTADPTQTVWVNQVPEPKQAKSRVHLDVHVRSVADVVALGAAVVDESHPWTVCQAPDGLEFCAFVREVVPQYRLYEVGVDCSDPQRLARWWADRLGADIGHDPQHPWWWVEGGDSGLPWAMVFAPVPEPKTVKNRIHWDVMGTVAEFVDAGAALLHAAGDLDWQVLADPEGNEFCVFAPTR